MSDVYWADPEPWLNIDSSEVETPCYIVDEALLEKNLQILDSVKERTGCKILLALKGFAMYSLFPLIRQYLYGVAASSLYEARLGKEEFNREVHVFSAAYKEAEMADIMWLASHIVFNSFSQWERYRGQIISCPRPNLSCGIRVNPEHSEVKTSLYDPCGKYSRLGITRRNFRPDLLDGIEGLHFHNLCELNADSLGRTLEVFEKKFGQFLGQMKWVNFGGGHHITRPDYDIGLLCRMINDFRKKYHHLEVYLEPGEAIVLNAGVLVAKVLDIVQNESEIAILDTSFAAHMPDVLEMPYQPEIIGARKAGELPFDYYLGGPSCLAGDQIGPYSFSEPLQEGQKLVFLDMAHYTMVKNNTFNGIGLPSIITRKRYGELERVKEFNYDDYIRRL